MNNTKRILSLVLALLLCVTLLPAGALASGEMEEAPELAEMAETIEAAGLAEISETIETAGSETIAEDADAVLTEDGSYEPALDGATTYTINGVSVSVYSSSITSNCYTYALEIYKKIWGVSFSGTSSSSNNMLRNITSLEGRRLTVENVKNYISAAALGSVIRLTDSSNAFSSSNGTGHSQLLVQKDENGFTVIESNVTGGRREMYLTWEGYVRWWAVSTSYRGYFQYIEWPNAPAYSGLSSSSGSSETTVDDSCSCSDSYAGYYTCTTTSSSLRIRSGHGTSYSSIGSIPSGATVYVSRSDGTWAHVEYNGITGYASMSYLTRSNDYKVTFGSSSVSVAAAAAAQNSVRFSGTGVETLSFSIDDPDICSVRWGPTDMAAGTSSLVITGKAAGTAEVTVILLGTNDTVLYSSGFSVTVEPVTYTVTYNANGGIGAPFPQTKNYGETLRISSTTPTRSGYTFLGWAASSAAAEAQYLPGGSYIANADATLWAVWQKIETPVVTDAASAPPAAAQYLKAGEAYSASQALRYAVGLADKPKG